MKNALTFHKYRKYSSLNGWTSRYCLRHIFVRGKFSTALHSINPSMNVEPFSYRPVLHFCRLAKPLYRTLLYLYGTVQDLADGLSGITIHHRFCAAAWIEMSLHVIEGLVTEFAARERVLLFDEFITAGFPYFEQSLVQSSLLFFIVKVALGRLCRCHVLLGSHCRTESDFFKAERTASTH